MLCNFKTAAAVFALLVVAPAGEARLAADRVKNQLEKIGREISRAKEGEKFFYAAKAVEFLHLNPLKEGELRKVVGALPDDGALNKNIRNACEIFRLNEKKVRSAKMLSDDARQALATEIQEKSDSSLKVMFDNLQPVEMGLAGRKGYNYFIGNWVLNAGLSKVLKCLANARMKATDTELQRAIDLQASYAIVWYAFACDKKLLNDFVELLHRELKTPKYQNNTYSQTQQQSVVERCSDAVLASTSGVPRGVVLRLQARLERDEVIDSLNQFNNVSGSGMKEGSALSDALSQVGIDLLCLFKKNSSNNLNKNDMDFLKFSHEFFGEKCVGGGRVEDDFLDKTIETVFGNKFVASNYWSKFKTSADDYPQNYIDTPSCLAQSLSSKQCSCIAPMVPFLYADWGLDPRVFAHAVLALKNIEKGEKIKGEEWIKGVLESVDDFSQLDTLFAPEFGYGVQMIEGHTFYYREQNAWFPAFIVPTLYNRIDIDHFYVVTQTSEEKSLIDELRIKNNEYTYPNKSNGERLKRLYEEVKKCEEMQKKTQNKNLVRSSEQIGVNGLMQRIIAINELKRGDIVPVELDPEGFAARFLKLFMAQKELLEDCIWPCDKTIGALCSKSEQFQKVVNSLSLKDGQDETKVQEKVAAYITLLPKDGEDGGKTKISRVLLLLFKLAAAMEKMTQKQAANALVYVIDAQVNILNGKHWTAGVV